MHMSGNMIPWKGDAETVAKEKTWALASAVLLVTMIFGISPWLTLIVFVLAAAKRKLLELL